MINIEDIKPREPTPYKKDGIWYVGLRLMEEQPVFSTVCDSRKEAYEYAKHQKSLIMSVDEVREYWQDHLDIHFLQQPSHSPESNSPNLASSSESESPDQSPLPTCEKNLQVSDS